jgi:hypothetical protein
MTRDVAHHCDCNFIVFFDYQLTQRYRCPSSERGKKPTENE